MLATIIAVTLAIQEVPHWEPSALTSVDTFDTVKRQEFGAIRSHFVRKSDRTNVVIRYSALNGEPAELFGFSEYNLNREYSSSISTIPIAIRYLRKLPTGRLNILATTNFELIRISISSELEQEPRAGMRVKQPKPFDFTDELPYWEKLTREAVAKAASRRLKASQSINIAGTQTPSMYSADSRTTFVNASQIASNLSFQLTSDELERTSTLTKQGKPTLTFAAGANAFKKGDIWINLPDTTILINGELWVPTTVLEHLN